MSRKNSKLQYLGLFILGASILAYGMSTMSDMTNVEGDDSTYEQAKHVVPTKPEKVVEVITPTPMGVNVEVNRNETLSGVLQDQGIDIVEVALAVEQINDVFDLRTLRAGQEIILELEELRSNIETEEQAPRHLKKISFQPSIDQIVNLDVNDKGDFVASVEKIALDDTFIKAKGKIENSFYESMIRAGVTDNVTLQLIAALSFVVDFQRDIQPGNKFEVLYQAYTKDSEIIKGRIPAYVKLQMKGETVEIYVVENADGSLAYYHGNGENVKKGLLRTPINGARISSGFGNRIHPVLGYSKMHTGVDFAAPTGTPIYAAGDGKIVRIGPFSTYGNYVKVFHNNTYQTAYAHISRFANGMRVGSQVRQGQVIAYVGMTGRATGPHLHFEVLKFGKQINPINAKFNIIRKLQGSQLAAFNTRKAKIQSDLKTAPTKEDLKKKADDAAAKAKLAAEALATVNGGAAPTTNVEPQAIPIPAKPAN